MSSEAPPVSAGGRRTSPAQRATRANDAESALRSQKVTHSSIQLMTGTEFTHTHSGSFLLELLQYAGWRLRVRGGTPATIKAARDGVELDVTRATLPEAAGVIFARAMRSGRNRRQTEGT